MLAAVLSFIALGKVGEIASSERSHFILADAEYGSVKVLHASRSTPGFIRAADHAARAARAASIGGETIHIARARAQAEVADLARAVGMDDLEIKLLPRAAGRTKIDVLEEVVLDVSGAYAESALVAFLYSLSDSEFSIVPVSVEVRRSADRPQINARIVLYALVSEPEA